MSLSIANRILLGYGLVLLLMVALGLLGLTQLSDARDTVEAVVTRNVAALGQLGSVRDNENAAQDARELVVTRFLENQLGRGRQSTDDAVAAWRQTSAQALDQLTRAVSLADTFRSQAISVERAQAWRQLTDALSAANAALATLSGVSDRQITAATAGDIAAVIASAEPLDAARQAFAQRLTAADQVMQNTIVVGQNRINSVYETSRSWLIAGLVLAAVLAILAALAVRRSIIGPLSGFIGFVQHVGQGDLASRLEAGGPQEIAGLAGTLNGMVEGLRQIARQSRESTEDLNAAVAEIRASTQQQAASVEEQLAAVQETAATVDEITHAGAQIGKRAQEVIASAQATAQTSTAGLKAVAETARAMDLIRDQAEAVAETVVSLSEKTAAIESIIATVNDVSERSHLLALNAAIEAAGAGESGQRFAVVAAEMKILADQAKDATAQVRAILGDIQRGINQSVMLTEEAVKRVSAGKKRTDITQGTIEEITASIQESVQTFQQIVASTNQQQLGIEQVMSALQNIRQASQQTAAGTRQLDSAAGNLSGLAQGLVGLVERYRL